MFKRLLVMAALAATLAACGNSTPTGANGEGSSTPPTTTTPTDGDLSAYCDIQTDIETFGTDLAEFDPSDPAAMRTFFDGMTDLLGQAVAAAPVDVKADLEEGLSLFTEMKVELDKVNYDFSKITPEVAQRFAEIGEFFQSSDLADLAAECGATSRSSGSSAG